ncbi:MAG: ABC transporter substrate-binding protein [Propionibacteriaceae bacterium]|nr:ABC transporter substrate-binding protein [Propionibacteriaceae bacterium]
MTSLKPIRRSIGIAAILAFGLVGALTGCTTPGTDPTPTTPTPGLVEFVDDLGNAVTVNNPQRVVACMGSFANMWELAGGTLIGATEDVYDQYELTSTDVETVGDFTAPNLELIIALEPDFVIMTGASGGKGGGVAQSDLRGTLVGAGITVAYFTVSTFEDYLRVLGIMTSITDRTDLYEANGTAVGDQIDALLAQVAGTAETPNVLLMTTYSGGTRVQDSSTMTGTMLAELGAVNLADAHPSLLRDFSLESIIELNPDFILVVPMGNDTEAAMKNLQEATAANPAWASLDAVKNERYVVLQPALFLYKPNANWADSYQKLFDILYT